MRKIRFQDVGAVVLTLAFAGPPLWWAGEALGAARQIARNETEQPADEQLALLELAKLLKL